MHKFSKTVAESVRQARHEAGVGRWPCTPSSGTRRTIYRAIANAVKTVIGEHAIADPRDKGLESAGTSFSTAFICIF